MNIYFQSAGPFRRGFPLVFSAQLWILQNESLHDKVRMLKLDKSEENCHNYATISHPLWEYCCYHQVTQSTCTQLSASVSSTVVYSVVEIGSSEHPWKDGAYDRVLELHILLLCLCYFVTKYEWETFHFSVMKSHVFKTS